ncbi:MAG: primosomal protein N' [Elusimicrobia bacterium]|nr:primosomal protein N' [Elusimicrobiota bacterium]
MILEVALPINIYKNFDYIADTDVKIGCRVVVPFNKKKLTGFVVAVKEKSELSLKKIIKVVDNEPFINNELMQLADWISKYYLCSLGSALNLILPQTSKLPSKEIEILNRRLSSDSLITHNLEQQSAIEKIILSLQISRQKTFLLYGMNDSGKTEIYVQTIEWCLNNNKSAIYLVPDVSLLSQFRELLRIRFGDKLGIWHSGLTQKEKNDFFNRLKSDKIKIVLGTRSAIFLPLKNPKLFILDEEDDDFYKNIQTPKYHAKDVAIQRAKIESGIVILGSATPSIKTYYETKTGEIEVLKLSARIDNRPMPKISIIDLKYTQKFAITKPLKYAITNAILQNKQVFLLINRRGWATIIKCSSCGNIVRCPKCSIPLVAHKNPAKLLCHYCGYKQDFYKSCPVCNSSVIYYGYGTEKVEEIVKGLFPTTKVLRMDADSEITYSEMFHIMKSGKPCVLIGTQIVAKGFDFPDMTLVGIINAYSGLYSADFRSAERTFSLITHSIGRCGRGSSSGQVVIQTENPEHYAIKYAAEFDYESFYKNEVEFRKEFSWPPFSKMINITISGKNENDVICESEAIADKLEKIKNLVVLGPVPKITSFLAGKYRWQILLKFQESDFPDISSRLLELDESHHKKKVNVVFDIDPLETV